MATPPTAATVAVPLSVLPPGFAPSAIDTFPVKPVAASPNAVRTATAIAGAIATPATVAEGCAVITSCVGTPAVAVAVKVTGLPDSPVAVALIVCVPSAAPRVHVVDARPAESESIVVAPGAPPDEAANVTDTPATGTPSAADTITETLCGSELPASPDCPLPPTAARTEARSCTVTMAVSVCPVRSCAVMVAVPRFACAVPAPVPVPAPVAAIFTTDVSELVKRIGVPAIT